MTPASKFSGISWKFLKLLIPVITLAAALVLAIYTFWKMTSAEVALVEKIETIADVHSLAVSHPIWTVDIDGITRSIQTLALYPEISCVEAVELPANRDHQWPERCKIFNSNEQLLSKELVLEGQSIGQLNLYYSITLKQEVLIGASFILLLVFVGGVIAYTALQLIVERPVSKLISSIETFEKVGIRKPVDWSSQDELGSVINAYNSMILQVEDNTNQLITAREQAESARDIKSRFLANMSHELRTPLNAVIGITEMLREEVGDVNADTEPYDRIAGSGRHLLNLIDEILDFSKLEAGQIRLAIEDMSILELLEDVCATAQPLADKRGNVLIQNYSGEPAMLMTDAFRLRQILINLLSNACKFTESGTITLTVRPSTTKPGVLFSVRDTGIGIPEDRMNMLFKEFSQADTSTTREYGGTGLGLAISDKLCKLLQGEITVKSTPGEGSEFSFVLPSDA